MRIACIALAGTLGAIGMFGHRRGGAVEPFTAAGYQLWGQPSPLLAAIPGLVIHSLWMVLWAQVFAAVMRRRRGTHASLEAIAVAGLAFLASVVLPGALIGPAATLAIGERAVVHAVLAVSLMIGTRVASRG